MQKDLEERKENEHCSFSLELEGGGVMGDCQMDFFHGVQPLALADPSMKENSARISAFKRRSWWW